MDYCQNNHPGTDDVSIEFCTEAEKQSPDSACWRAIDHKFEAVTISAAWTTKYAELAQYAGVQIALWPVTRLTSIAVLSNPPPLVRYPHDAALTMGRITVMRC
jgi:hypothetical protein